MVSNWQSSFTIGRRTSIGDQLTDAENPRYSQKFRYPNLRDGSDLVLASDYSGEHALPEFHVFGFLLTTRRSILQDWEPFRAVIRAQRLTDNRRMAFKNLSDAVRINAFPEFLEVASRLNGVLVCVAVDKSHSLQFEDVSELLHKWTPDTLQKMLHICCFGAELVNGLRAIGQRVHWITDDDAIVVNEFAKIDAMRVLRGQLHEFPNERLEVGLGIASLFDDDMRAEDLVAIPDLASGAFSESLTQLGKANIPTKIVGATGHDLYAQVKTTLITAWRHDDSTPLKHLSLVVRPAQNGQTIFSYCQPFVRLATLEDQIPEGLRLNAKWRRALTASLLTKGMSI